MALRQVRARLERAEPPAPPAARAGRSGDSSRAQAAPPASRPSECGLTGGTTGAAGRSDTLRLIRAAVLTISTSVARREAEDLSGPKLAAAAEDAGCEVVAMEVVPDDFRLIEDRLNHFVSQRLDLVFTTGGTGMTPNDVTPEATRAVIEREAPGFAETLRAEGRRYTPLGILTRGVSGIAGQTLIVNFPGSPKSVDQLFPVLAPTLKHVVRTLGGDSSHHESDRAG